jgi:hypothetical protein
VQRIHSEKDRLHHVRDENEKKVDRRTQVGTPSQAMLESTCEILVMVIFDLDHTVDLLNLMLRRKSIYWMDENGSDPIEIHSNRLY